MAVSVVVGVWLVLDIRSQLAAIEDHLADADRESDARFAMRADEHRGITTDIHRVLSALSLSITEHTHECR